MNGHFQQRASREVRGIRGRKRRRFIRPWLESLEDRTMLDTGGLPAAIILGRTLGTSSTAATSTPAPSYFVGEVENNQVTISYTAFNEQADTESGVLLTTTLQPGVKLISSTVTLDGTTSTQLPDQNGQNLAWSLAPIQGYDRESVAVTVGLATPIPLQLDSGAHVDAMLDAGAIAATTPAATLQPGNVSDPRLLASTVDADTNDPYIQEEAAALNYDPTQIFNFLHAQIGYNSYLGSVRGARGTLWSNAGNALDVASLGVALMRASGIPAQYVSGTLSQSQAQALILSMFPAQYQTVGYIAPGTHTSAPASDPQLLSETENHDWIQFDTGKGMQDADPLMPGAAIGEAFATPTGTFAEVPDSLQAKTEVRLTAEIYSQADAAFGLDPFQDTVVLDQTFDDAYLVGRPLTVGDFVTTSSIGSLFTSTTNTYAPYLEVGDAADPDPSQDQIIGGQDFQEVLTSFPLASQILTGLFLNITTTSAQGQSSTIQKTIFDRIGVAARQEGSAGAIDVSPDSGPALTEFDKVTLAITTSDQPTSSVVLGGADLGALSDQLNALLPGLNSTDPTTQAQAIQEGLGPAREDQVQLASLLTDEFLASSDQFLGSTAPGFLSIGYFDAPHIVALTVSTSDATSSQGSLSLEFDVLSDPLRTYADPGQAESSAANLRTYEGIGESIVEGQVLATQAGFQVSSAFDVFSAAVTAGVPLEYLDQSTTGALAQLPISAEAKARISQELSAGEVVLVPTAMVAFDGDSTIAWLEIDPSSGAAIAVADDGSHEGLADLSALYSKFTATLAGVIRVASTGLVDSVSWNNAFLGARTFFLGAKNLQQLFAARTLAEQIWEAAVRDAIPYGYRTGVLLAGKEAIQAAFTQASHAGGFDPPIGDVLVSPLPQSVPNSGASSAVPADVAFGTVSGEVREASISVSNQLAASWASASSSVFTARSLDAANATIAGPSPGTGTVTLSAAGDTPVLISGSNRYDVNGTGSLSFYGPAGSSLGVGGDWDAYSATITGNLSITLTVAAGVLTLDGQALPAGTYTITTGSATLSGSGATTSPNFAGSASIAATGGTIDLGPGSGSVSVGGKPLDATDGATLDGYNGTITVSANGDGTDSASLNGNTGKVLQVAGSQSSLTTDQNTPVTFAANVLTSLADTDNLTANAPPGWTIAFDSSGAVTATPAPCLQGGTYPIQIIAQSQTDANLEAQTTVEVTIMPTQPGITLSVQPDPLSTVPYDGADLPTGFQATIQNLGPAADKYDLTFSNVPSGFTLLNSGTSVTVPAGQTGILGVYLQPNTGQPIPPQGTQLSFTVTATSTTDPSITQTRTVTFTMPNVDAVTITSNPTSLNTIPGTPVTATLTLTDAGNVPETVSLAATLPAVLMASTLSPVRLAVGQTTTETITLTPAASTPLNSTLDATITATFGPSASPVTQTVDIPLQVEVPGASAIATASVAAGQLGNTNLADRLNDLSTALTSVVQKPTSAVYQGEAQASLAAVIALLGADAYLSPLIPALQSDAAALGKASSAGAVQTAVSKLGNDLDALGSTLADEAAHGFSLSLLENSRVGQPQVPTMYQVVLQNTGTQATTYDLGIAGLPSGVSGELIPSSITLQPGQSTQIANGTTTVNAMITSTSAAELPSFSFTINATAQGASEIAQATVAEFAARTASVQVISVTTDPPFTNPGGQVDVSAGILDALNQEQQAQVSYTVTDPGGNVVFTSQPVSTTLSVLSTLSTVDLGSVDPTGLADGEYTIDVSVDDASGNPIPGATGAGRLLIGSPVTASLSTTPTTLPAGSGTVTDTLEINASGATREPTVQVTVPGTADPYLAGMPDGSTASFGDTAPAESPAQVVGISIVPGTTLIFTASGSVNFGGGPGGTDGLPNYFTPHAGGAQNGISGLTAPVDALLGVFLGPDQPDGSPAPANLDFTSTGNVPGGVNYTSLAPALKQVFFIGDGLTGTGASQTITVPAGATRLFLATMDGYGWYNNSGSFQVQVTLLTSSGITIQDQATVPTNNGVSIDPSSFSIAPTSVVTNSDNTETLEWNLNLPSGTSSQAITWQSDVTGLQPGQSLLVVQSATVNFVSQGTPGSLSLPAQFVTGEEIMGINPATETVQPGAPASYDVTVLNPTNNPVTYGLSVQGVPSSWVSVEPSVTVGANGSVEVPLVLKSDAFAALADYGFTVSADGNDGALASVDGDLVLQGQPVPPDPESHGIVAILTASQATVGQETSAHDVVQLTNTGSADDTFSLAVTGLPASVTATFGETTVDVPPGASNFRDVPLTLAVQSGTRPGTYPFALTATSTDDPSVTGTTDGTLTVTAGGVTVALNPGSAAPGSSFQATVTNTGTVAETYKLALAGPAALVASLGMKQVTLAPGASQVVPITTDAVDFAVQGSLPLMAAATSTTNPAIQGSASANLSIPSSQGMTAAFSPPSQPLSKPGIATFLLMVHNTGNTEDSYSATIIGTNGPVTATLVGLDGSSTQSIPTFILPGLSTGAIALEADIASVGTGMVTVQVKSLTNAESASPAATTMVLATTPPPPPHTFIDGPQISKVLRYGYHWMPTTLVLYFNQPLGPATAQDANDYRIVGPEGGTIRVNSAVYNPSTLTVTLHPSQRIDIHYPYELIVDGTAPDGLTNTQGQLLDGANTGKPGSDYRGSLTWRNLVFGEPPVTASLPSKSTTRNVRVVSDRPARVINSPAAPHKISTAPRPSAKKAPDIVAVSPKIRKSTAVVLPAASGHDAHLRASRTPERAAPRPNAATRKTPRR